MLVYCFITIQYSLSQQIQIKEIIHDETTISIKYDLEGKSNDEYKVYLQYLNDDKEWSDTLFNVSGDCGNNVTGGKNKMITWNATQEIIKPGKQKIKIKLLVNRNTKDLEYPTAAYTDPSDGMTYQVMKIGNIWWMCENYDRKPTSISTTNTGQDQSDRTGMQAATHTGTSTGSYYYWNSIVNSLPKGWMIPGVDDWKNMLSLLNETDRLNLTFSFDYGRKEVFWTNTRSSTGQYLCIFSRESSNYNLGTIDVKFVDQLPVPPPPYPVRLISTTEDFLTTQVISYWIKVDIEPKISSPPFLNIPKESIALIDDNGNNALDAMEKANIKFLLRNDGAGTANKVTITATLPSLGKGVLLNDPIVIGIIPSGNSVEVQIPLYGTIELEERQVECIVTISERNGFGINKTITFRTNSFRAPEISIIDYKVQAENGIIKQNKSFELDVLIQNTGQGIANEVTMDLNLPHYVYCLSPNQHTSLNQMMPGESRSIKYNLIVANAYTDKMISLGISLDESLHKYAKDWESKLEIEKPGYEISSIPGSGAPVVGIPEISLTSDIEKDIPINTPKQNRFALVIGNEDYTGYQKGIRHEANVPFARRDAQTVKEYFNKTLGIPARNIFFLTDATASQMNQHILLLKKLVIAYGEEAELYFYYAGHGLPDEITREVYIIPVDVAGIDLSFAIKLADVYKILGSSKAQRIIVFLDACFTGGGRGPELLAYARSVKIKPKTDEITGNMIVFTASSGTQSALPYMNESHGLFTYFLLKKLKETSGKMTYKEWFDDVQRNVSLESLRINMKEQDPDVYISANIRLDWERWAIN